MHRKWGTCARQTQWLMIPYKKPLRIERLSLLSVDLEPQLLISDTLQRSPHNSFGLSLSCCDEEEFQLPALLLGSLPKIEAIKVHHLGPGRNKVMYEHLLRVAAAINFSE